MAGPDGTYPNSKVGLERDAESIFIDPDGYFRVNGNQYSGESLDVLFKNNATVIMMDSGTALSAQGVAVYPPILPSTYGIIIFSAVEKLIVLKS